jgi:hypothetical protein
LVCLALASTSIGGGIAKTQFAPHLPAGAFVLGMGAGVWFNSEASFRPNNVASTEMIDRKTPNSELCMANGYSSMVFDQRIFVSFNPCAPTSWSRLLLSIDSQAFQAVTMACSRVQVSAMRLPELCRQVKDSCGCCSSRQKADTLPCSVQVQRVCCTAGGEARVRVAA